MLFDFCETIDSSETVVLTHITSPFLKKDTIFKAVEMLAKTILQSQYIQFNKFKILFGLKKIEVNPVNFLQIECNALKIFHPYLFQKGFFIAKACDILDQRKRLPEPLIFFPLNHIQSVEIDNFDDLEFARILGGKV